MCLITDYTLNEVIKMSKQNNSNSSDGIYKNLINQIEKIDRNCTEKSYATRARYKVGMERFARYLSDEYRLTNIKNIKAKHIISYCSYLTDTKQASSSFIKTELSSIRFYHRHSGGKNILPTNSQLNIEPRHPKEYTRGFMDSELTDLKRYSKEVGRLDVYHGINLSSTFGLRLNELVSEITPQKLSSALQEKELHVVGKGGMERYIQILDEKQIKAIEEALSYANERGLKANDKLLVKDNDKGGVLRCKRSLQAFLSNHQNEFRNPNRGELVETNKKVAKTLTWHSARHYYAENLYSKLYEETKDKEYSKRFVSENLGHHRL